MVSICDFAEATATPPFSAFSTARTARVATLSESSATVLNVSDIVLTVSLASFVRSICCNVLCVQYQQFQQQLVLLLPFDLYLRLIAVMMQQLALSSPEQHR